LLQLLRVAYCCLIVGIAVFVASLYVERETFKAIAFGLVILLFGGFILLTDVREKQKEITTLSAVYFGLLLGLLLGWLFWMALEPLLGYAFAMPVMVRVGQILITVICCYVTISTLLQTKDEFRFINPYVEFSKQVKGGRPLVLDTSVIIDG